METNINYDGLFSLLRKKNIKLYSLIRIAGINRYTIDCIKKGKPITMTAAEKICSVLGCGIGEVVKFSKENK